MRVLFIGSLQLSMYKIICMKRTYSAIDAHVTIIFIYIPP